MIDLPDGFRIPDTEIDLATNYEVELQGEHNIQINTELTVNQVPSFIAENISGITNSDALAVRDVLVLFIK